MRLIFATWPEVEYQAVVLTYEKAEDRLISYAFARELPEQFMEEYIKRGCATRLPKKKGKK